MKIPVREGGGALGAEQAPLEPVEIIRNQAVPLQPVKDHIRAYIHTTAHGEPCAEAAALKVAAAPGAL